MKKEILLTLTFFCLVQFVNAHAFNKTTAAVGSLNGVMTNANDLCDVSMANTSLIMPPVVFEFLNSGQALGIGSIFSKPWLRDIDNDGDIDLIYSGNSLTDVFIYKNDGVGNFTLAHTISGLIDHYSITIGKFDADNLNDIFIADNGIYKNDGDGTSFTKTQTTTNFPAGSFITFSITGDIDDDGDIDIFSVKRLSTQVFYHNDGTGLFTEKTITGGNTDARGGVAGNFDSDSELEIVATACWCSPDEERVFDYNSTTSTFDFHSDLPLSGNNTNTIGGRSL